MLNILIIIAIDFIITRRPYLSHVPGWAPLLVPVLRLLLLMLSIQSLLRWALSLLIVLLRRRRGSLPRIVCLLHWLPLLPLLIVRLPCLLVCLLLLLPRRPLVKDIPALLHVLRRDPPAAGACSIWESFMLRFHARFAHRVCLLSFDMR